MMPLPWLTIFFSIFFCLFSIILYFSSFKLASPSEPIKALSVAEVFCW